MYIHYDTVDDYTAKALTEPIRKNFYGITDYANYIYAQNSVENCALSSQAALRPVRLRLRL